MHYTRVGRASELESAKDRAIYRALEIFPGAFAWATLLGVIFLSWYKPVWVAFFIITFDIYWLIKTIYFSIHMRVTYTHMKKQMKVDWLGKVESLDGWRNVYHLIILPTHLEPIDLVRKSLQALVDATYPKDRMIVVLGVEERDGADAIQLSEELKKEFNDSFFKFLVTVHPDGIAGELKGKSANAVWAVKRAKEEVVDALEIPYKDIVVSCFDVDTRAYPKYFACLAYHYLTVDEPTRTSYQPVPIYNNNIWQAPCVSRVVANSATFWQMIQQQRPERLSTFSSQSISFQALVDVDFWLTNVVSEDSRIFWQCLLHYDGHYEAVPLHYPVSMDANLASNFFQTAINVYKQQRRWGWGVENVPYLFFGFMKNKKISLKTKIHWIWVQIEGFWSWATNALLIFMLGWLPLFLGGHEFNVTVLSYNLPRLTRTLMTLAMVGLIGSAIYGMLLLPKPPQKYGFFKKSYRYAGMLLQWILVPVTILVFGALPGLEAQTRLMLGKYMGFWVTPK